MMISMMRNSAICTAVTYILIAAAADTANGDSDARLLLSVHAWRGEHGVLFCLKLHS